MESGDSTAPNASANIVRWSGEEIAQTVDQFDRCRPDFSRRQFGRHAGLPRFTLQFWAQRRELLPPARAEVDRLAVEWATLLQRSSSCVEGRNGQLSLCHHRPPLLGNDGRFGRTRKSDPRP
jgi:hypothetical protein